LNSLENQPKESQCYGDTGRKVSGAAEKPLNMADVQKPTGEIVLYQTEDGQARVECRFADENVWLTQALMADLFQTTPQNITLHLRAIYQEGELLEEATCKDYLQVQTEGARQVQRRLRNHNLDPGRRASFARGGPPPSGSGISSLRATAQGAGRSGGVQTARGCGKTTRQAKGQGAQSEGRMSNL
jgi:hypothetical protein